MEARLLPILLLVAGCSGDAPPYRPPAEVKVVLTPGQKLVCENWLIFMGLPLGNRATAVIYHEKHFFECHMQPESAPARGP
jgi:hypothetical protein